MRGVGVAGFEEEEVVMDADGLTCFAATDERDASSDAVVADFAVSGIGVPDFEGHVRLSYLPMPGEDMSQVKVVAPVTDRFIVIEGDAAGGKPVENLTFRGLTFQHAQWLTPPGGFEPSQAAATMSAVVMVDDARKVVIEDCEIGHIGTYGVWFRHGCRDSTLRRSHIHDFGAVACASAERPCPPTNPHH